MSTFNIHDWNGEIDHWNGEVIGCNKATRSIYIIFIVMSEIKRISNT